MKKAKMLWAFSFKAKTQGVFAWECGARKAPKQIAWGKRNSKPNAWGQLHLGCHGLPEQRFPKKSRSRNPMKTVPNPGDSYHFGLGHVGEYFIYCPHRNAWGKHEKSKNALGFLIQSKNAWGGSSMGGST